MSVHRQTSRQRRIGIDNMRINRIIDINKSIRAKDEVFNKARDSFNRPSYYQIVEERNVSAGR